MEIRNALPADAEACVGIVTSLPEYFTPDTHEKVRAGVAAHRCWVAAEAGEVIGFAIAEVRHPTAAEITWAAVLRERQNTGVGTAVVQRALADLRNDGIVLVEVKTLDASADYEQYVATRAFWERRGFVQVDCIDPLPGWQPGNPAAIYVAGLTGTVAGSGEA